MIKELGKVEDEAEVAEEERSTKGGRSGYVPPTADPVCRRDKGSKPPYLYWKLILAELPRNLKSGSGCRGRPWPPRLLRRRVTTAL